MITKVYHVTISKSCWALLHRNLETFLSSFLPWTKHEFSFKQRRPSSCQNRDFFVPNWRRKEGQGDSVIQSMVIIFWVACNIMHNLLERFNNDLKKILGHLVEKKCFFITCVAKLNDDGYEFRFIRRILRSLASSDSSLLKRLKKWLGRTRFFYNYKSLYKQTPTVNTSSILIIWKGSKNKVTWRKGTTLRNKTSFFEKPVFQ